MPTRFRKTFKILPGVKANLSKSGLSFTVGTKGYHLNFSKRGVRQTVGLPGSGISHTSYLIKNDPKPEKEEKEGREEDTRQARVSSKEEAAPEPEHEEPAASQKPRRRRTPAWVLLLGILVIYLGALVLGLIPMNFLSQLLHTLTEWTRGLGL